MLSRKKRRMTNIQAIDLLKDLEQCLDDYCELNDEGKTAFRMAITALEVFGNSEQLPSAKPKAIRPKFLGEDRYRKNYFQLFPHCPKCNYELETGDCYCRVCGCHIDWSEDDE